MRMNFLQVMCLQLLFSLLEVVNTSQKESNHVDHGTLFILLNKELNREKFVSCNKPPQKKYNTPEEKYTHEMKCQ